MTWHSDIPTRPDRARAAGFSLLEMLVVLAILAIVLTATASLMRRPPDRIELRRHAAEMIDDAMAVRLIALNQGRQIKFSPAPKDTIALSDCSDREIAPIVTFLPDGSAAGGPICLRLNKTRIRVTIDRLTGLMAMETE